MSDLTQLVVVTIAACGALGFVMRSLWPTRGQRTSSDKPSCPNCASSTPCGDAASSSGR
jgi:hypothetical protein